MFLLGGIAMEPVVIALLAALTGSFITVLGSYGAEALRLRLNNKDLAIKLARAIASEVHGHKWVLDQILADERTLKSIKALQDLQWQTHQKDLWGLNPKLGVLFRQHYDALSSLQSTSFLLDTDLNKVFTPVMNTANVCLREADFPLRFGGSTVSVSVCTSASGNKERV